MREERAATKSEERVRTKREERPPTKREERATVTGMKTNESY